MEERETQRGLDRLNNFSDAVVAIAATLLVLPLVDSAASIGDRSVGAFLGDVRQQIFAFVLSFVVIYRFWSIHHRAYSRLVGYSGPLVAVNCLWLLSIVFLPFPTELLGLASTVDRAVIVLYIGTMCVTAVTLLLAQWISVRQPGLLSQRGRDDTPLAVGAVNTGLLLLALVVAVALPAIGLYALLLLLIATPVERRMLARRGDARP